MGGGAGCGCRPFPFGLRLPIWVLPVSTGYGDKLRRAIGAADPGAVPGGSTIFLVARQGN